jgi:hypothetical protein
MTDKSDVTALAELLQCLQSSLFTATGVVYTNTIGMSFKKLASRIIGDRRIIETDDCFRYVETRSLFSEEAAETAFTAFLSFIINTTNIAAIDDNKG